MQPLTRALRQQSSLRRESAEEERFLPRRAGLGVAGVPGVSVPRRVALEGLPT